jgi:hypothetical protein
VIALVDGEQEHRVSLGDPVTGETVEEGFEGRVVLTQLRLMAGLAGAEGIVVVYVVLVVVNVGDVGIGHGTPASWMAAVQPRALFASMPSKPGKPGSSD